MSSRICISHRCNDPIHPLAADLGLPYCRRCYQRHHGKPLPGVPPVCYERGCPEPPGEYGYCITHQLRRYPDVRPTKQFLGGREPRRLPDRRRL